MLDGVVSAADADKAKLGAALVPVGDLLDADLFEWVMKLPDHEAEKAIREIGTNALPYLLKWIRYDMPSWKMRFYETVNPALSTLNSEWGLYDERQRRFVQAPLAFEVLGAQAKPAIPELIRMLNGPKAIQYPGHQY